MSEHRTVLAGLIGAGIQASRTPALHEREGDAQGFRYLYRLIDLDTLASIQPPCPTCWLPPSAWATPG